MSVVQGVPSSGPSGPAAPRTALIAARVGELVSSSVNDRRNRLFQEGQNLHNRGFIPEALCRYGQALELDPEFAR